MKFWRRACTFLIIFVLVFQICGCAALERSHSPGRANVSPLVEQWRDEVVLIASELGLEAYVELILAMIAQESGGDSTRHPDIMQYSESAGLAPNSITDPMESIRQGMRYFSGLLEKGKTAGVCEKTVLQSYNFGEGYINYIKNNYGGNAIYNVGTVNINNSNIESISDFQSDSSNTSFTYKSIGINNLGEVTIKNSYAYGSHSGIYSTGTLLVDGGTYEGYAFGGIYYAGSNTTNYLKNATVKYSIVKDGSDLGTGGSNNTALYVGGGSGNKIYIDKLLNFSYNLCRNEV